MSLSLDYSDGRFELGKTTLILGKRLSGKTSLVLTNIFLKFQSKINYLFVVSNDQKYKEITNHLFNENQLAKIFQEIQLLNRQENKLLIIDEITNHRNPIIECLLINACFFNITIIMVSQIGDFNLVTRDYIANIVFGHDRCVTILRNIFDKYGSIYDDFTHFFNVISCLGKDEFLFRSNNKTGLIRVNDHWFKFLYSYKTFVRYDLLMKINEEKKDDDLLKKENNMMNEVTEIKRKLHAQ